MISKYIWSNLHNENSIKASLKSGAFLAANYAKKLQFFLVIT